METRILDIGTGHNLTRAEFLLFQELVSRASGLRMDDGDWSPLRTALCERAATISCSSFGEYYELLVSPQGAKEMDRLIELLTVHETAFFRNRSHFDLLARRIVPELLARNSATRTLRLWSAGCSTGQEAYSMAISLLESVPNCDTWRIEVLATDISHRALEVARGGVYSDRAVRGLDPVLLSRYFERVPEGFRVRDQVRRLVRFEHLNLVKEPFPLSALSPRDVVFCENVTIYFKIESTRRVVRSFYDTLCHGGYLFLGYSETLWQISDDFLLRQMDDTFVYQRPWAEAAGAGAGQEATAGQDGTMRPVPEHRHWRAMRRSAWSPNVPPPRKVATLQDAARLHDARRFEEALLAVEQLLSENPADSSAHLLASKLRADREEMGPALRHCRRALEMDPLLEEAHHLMGVLLLRSGDASSAAESLGKVIYLNPSGERAALARFHLAGIRAEEGDRSAAVREYRNALRLLERLPRDELVGEFAADFLAGVCRRRIDELERRR